MKIGNPTFSLHRLFFPADGDMRAVVQVALPEEETDRAVGITIEFRIEGAHNLTIDEVTARAFALARQAMAAATA